MPDDLKPLTQLTNLSPNQLRNNLRRFAQQQTEAQTRASNSVDEGTVPVSLNLLRDPGINLPPSPIFPNQKNTSETPNIPAEVGTFNTPYVTGSGRTNAFPTPADDSWDIGSQPAGFDGVIIADDFDIFNDTSGDVSKDVSLDAGGSITITSSQVLFYRRRKSYDSNGRLIHVGPQEVINSAPQASIVTFT